MELKLENRVNSQAKRKNLCLSVEKIKNEKKRLVVGKSV